MLKESIGTDLLETYLSLSSETWSKEIAGQFERLKNLKTLRLVCKRLKAVVDAKIITAKPETNQLHYLLQCNWELKKFITCTSIGYAPPADSLTFLLDSVFIKFPLLESVALFMCSIHGSGLKEFPKSIGRLENLTSLYLGSCENINIDSLAPLRHCHKLSDLSVCLTEEDTLKLPGLLSNLPALESLQLTSRVMSIPEDFYKFTQLKELSVHFTTIEEISESIGQLICLTKLHLVDCHELKTLPDAIGQLSSLIELDLEICDKITTLPDSIGNLQSLRRLMVGACDEILELPDSITKLSSIEEIEIYGCDNIDIPEEMEETLNRIPKFSWYNED